MLNFDIGVALWVQLISQYPMNMFMVLVAKHQFLRPVITTINPPVGFDSPSFAYVLTSMEVIP